MGGGTYRVYFGEAIIIIITISMYLTHQRYMHISQYHREIINGCDRGDDQFAALD